MKIKLKWRDPIEGNNKEVIKELPVAIGRQKEVMPSEWEGKSVAYLLLPVNDDTISRYHAIICQQNETVILIDNSSRGTEINGNRIHRNSQEIRSGDKIIIGSHQLNYEIIREEEVKTSPVNPPGEVFLRLKWQHPVTGEEKEIMLATPIAIGRKITEMPAELNGKSVQRLEIEGEKVSRYHLLITYKDENLLLTDRSSNGTYINNKKILKTNEKLNWGDTIKIDNFEISCLKKAEKEDIETIFSESISIYDERPEKRTTTSTIVFDPETDELAPVLKNLRNTRNTSEPFPPPEFERAKLISIATIRATKLPVKETVYAALGGGLGSYAWVDALRISGVKAENITAIGIEEKPYGRYQRLCRNSQIPPHERLRSGSDSTPDNIWAWPGYAWREAWREINSGQIKSALYHLWQVFAEPILTDTYTPRSGNVFASIDREAKRIGWESIRKLGRILKIRKTDDGRYAIAISSSRKEDRQKYFLIANYAQLAIGYPAVNFLPDLQEYRLKTGDFHKIINAYENHEHIYKHLATKGGTIILRGRGIVSSRIIQRIHEIREANTEFEITIVHLMRSNKSQGNRSGKAQREVKNQWEFQPYNWPKSTWGGDGKAMLERASAMERKKLLSEWGGTTTAERRDWRNIVQNGLDRGWYKIVFGNVEKVDRNPRSRLISFVASPESEKQLMVEGDFIIDATGLESKPEDSLLLNDLIQHYNLPLNPLGRLDVTNDFEINSLRNDRGRIYASGSMTLGGPYAPVDSFIGLQYTARQSVDDLANINAPEVQYLNGLGSFLQWLKWVRNQSP